MRKSYKRETALGLLAFWLGMSVWGVFDPNAASTAESIGIQAIAFAMLAFGMEGYRQVEETKNAAFRPE